ncbi:Sel1 domain protein repeat-containing protein, partial [mine drainage metagenome]
LKLETNNGDAYFLGQGVPQDYAKAFQYYKHAASHGFASAQNKLGLMYQHALSVPQSYAKAAKWYLLAAGQGDSAAENNLGLLYERGQGVPKDTVYAYEWFDLSAINARSEQIIQSLAKQHMQEIASHMTAAQIARAQAKALTWLKRHDRAQSNSH